MKGTLTDNLAIMAMKMPPMMILFYVVDLHTDSTKNKCCNRIELKDGNDESDDC